MNDQYAVIGNPVEHSQSPVIHEQFAIQTGQSLAYTTVFSELDAFKETVLGFINDKKGKGLNVTVPFKEQAFDLCDEVSDYAQKAGAVNTLSFIDGKIIGANTDGIGIVRDITQNHHFPLSGRKILILGAGGAVKGVLQPILDQNPQLVFIANRTDSKSKSLAAEYGDSVSGGGYPDIPEDDFDVIINGTSASIQGDVPDIPEHATKALLCCYDMMYGDKDTAFMTWAKAHYVPVVHDGLGMLVEQAAESFSIWRDVSPDTESVLSYLKRQRKR